jgi:H+/gluconate symporter-like permease
MLLKGEADVVFKKVITAAAAVAMMAGSTVAAAQTAAVAPANETVEGSELRGGFIIPLVAIVAIILGILAATHNNDDDLPHSP